MPRTIWEWLEIEETADRNLIRKAYARQSKKYHPEDAPEEAKHLREAYKAALARADGKNKAVLPKKDPEAVCEEILEVIEDGADKDSRNGSGSREGTRRESHRESRTASEEGERYNCPEEGKEAASKAGRESLRESRSVSEESYQYHLHSQQKEKGQGGGDRKEDSSSGSSFQYNIDDRMESRQRESGKPENTEPDTSYRYHIHQFDVGRKERVGRLLKRFSDIYENAVYRNSYNLWTTAIKEYFTKEDLKDPYVVSAVIYVLEYMPGLGSMVWHKIHPILFRFSKKNAEWMRLRERFEDVYRLNSVRDEAGGDIGSKKWSSYGRGIHITCKVVAAVLILGMCFNLWFQKNVIQEHRMQEYSNSLKESVILQQRSDLDIQDYIHGDVNEPEENANDTNVMNYQEMRELMGQNDSDTLGRYSYGGIYRRDEGDGGREESGTLMVLDFQDVRAFQDRYKDGFNPYRLDLNGDGYDDLVRYDFEKDCFVVELYDPDTSEYVLQGTVDEYLEEHPEKSDAGYMALFSGQAFQE